jgi:site-specific DNA-methyltransferase (adenine-specific)/site-specific DNA-methyltransferase (cytosine-N4-specific)
MDAADGLRTLPDGSVDAVVTDPPYAEVDRAYGRLTETQWRDLMDGVVAETRRVLAPTGSAVFILQPNSERVGRMRPWLFRWMADMAETWNLIQDAWWWNASAPPTVHCNRTHGLMRPSMKACVWLGEPTCYRHQDAVLWAPSEAMKAVDREDRVLRRLPSGQSVRRGRIAATVDERGGVTPFNVLPISNGSSNGTRSAGAKGHGAGTPYPLAAWWVRYISPVGGVVVDPFAGTGTMGHAALDQGRLWWGCDSDPQWACLDGDTMPTMPMVTAS